jgi:excisionase family DNA binding protein
MAGMFYSLKETAQQLGKTEDQVKQLVKEGKLREFRDGSNLLFKIDEVNSLLSEGIDMALEDIPVEADGFDGMELEEAPVEEQSADGFEEISEEAPLLDEDLFKLGEEEGVTLEPMAEVESTSELGLAPEETAGDEAPADDEAGEGMDDLLFLADEEQPAATDGAADSLTDDLSDGTEEEISLAGESGVLASESGSDITAMDTAFAGEEGINVLGESSTEFNVTEDSMAETAVGPAGSSAEASLEEIEDDVSLDSFGSGSGLLDLSLQADDTSLGGILDEIYTSEGAGEGESSDTEPAAIGDEASFDDITSESEPGAGGEEEMTMPEPIAVMPMAVGGVYAEAAPDAQSNILGMLLFVPMLALLYTAIVAVAGLRGVTPSILSSIQAFVWYILGGAIVVSLIVVGASFMAGRERSEAPVRARKEKKSEKPGKKAKAEKPAKAAKTEKPAKEKKSFFGKGKKK